MIVSANFGNLVRSILVGYVAHSSLVSDVTSLIIFHLAEKTLLFSVIIYVSEPAQLIIGIKICKVVNLVFL